MDNTGEALITIGGPGGWGPELLSEAELATILKRVETVMGAAFADMTILRQRKVPSNSEAAGETVCILLLWRFAWLCAVDMALPVQQKVADVLCKSCRSAKTAACRCYDADLNVLTSKVMVMQRVRQRMWW